MANSSATNSPKAEDGPLEDGYRRRIDHLRVSVSDRCNRKSVYCYPARPGRVMEPKRLQSASEILRLVELDRLEQLPLRCHGFSLNYRLRGMGRKP